MEPYMASWIVALNHPEANARFLPNTTFPGLGLGFGAARRSLSSHIRVKTAPKSSAGKCIEEGGLPNIGVAHLGSTKRARFSMGPVHPHSNRTAHFSQVSIAATPQSCAA